MDRRSFLKVMGLGGTALLAPKPFEVIAARMADISGPPLHAGLCRFRELGSFTLLDMGIVFDGWQQPSTIIQAKMADFLKNWTVHMAVRRQGGHYLKISQKPISRSLFGFNHKEMDQGCLQLSNADTVEVWVVSDGQPRYPLPPLTACIYGPLPASGCEVRQFASLPVRAVRLERSRAIELGLASTSDPYEIIQ